MNKLLVTVCVAVCLMLVSVEAHRRGGGGGRGGRGGSGGRGKGGHDLDNKLRQACEVTPTPPATITTTTCAATATCNQGPVTFTVNDTSYTAKYCSDLQHPSCANVTDATTGEKVRGVCKIDQSGASVYVWNCKDGDACGTTSTSVIYNGASADAYVCPAPTNPPRSKGRGGHGKRG